MPHCIIEYSHELSTKINIKTLMQELYSSMCASNLFSSDSIKIRAKKYEDYLLSNKQGFVHISLYILNTRSEKQKQDLATSIQTSLLKQITSLDISLTTAIFELDQQTYQKA
jgi:5-carboxymethyl-2-hydroxymuconate isomerase